MSSSSRYRGDPDLVIAGERRSESERDEGGWHRSERSFGRFRRTVPLPARAGECLLIHNHLWHRSLRGRCMARPRLACNADFSSGSKRRVSEGRRWCCR